MSITNIAAQGNKPIRLTPAVKYDENDPSLAYNAVTAAEDAAVDEQIAAVNAEIGNRIEEMNGALSALPPLTEKVLTLVYDIHCIVLRGAACL